MELQKALVFWKCGARKRRLRKPHLPGKLSIAKLTPAVEPDGADGRNVLPFSHHHSPRKTDPIFFLILQSKLHDKYLTRISHVHLNLVEDLRGRIKAIT